MKRYQDCNWIIKLWRCRWYFYVPFGTFKNIYFHLLFSSPDNHLGIMDCYKVAKNIAELRMEYYLIKEN